MQKSIYQPKIKMSRIKIECPEIIIAEVKLRIRIGDINYGNHVGNDAFVALIHEARLQWLQQNDYTELDIEGTGLIMSDLAFEFKNEAFYGEEICIRIGGGEISKVGFELYYEMITQRKGNAVMLAKAKTGMVCYDYNLKRMTNLPEVLKSMLQSSV